VQQAYPTAAGSGVEERSSQVSSVLKAFGLLETIAASGGLSLSELSRRNDLHPSTAHRLLHTLIGIGYVRQDPATRRYLLGPRTAAIGLATPVNRHGALQEAAAPYLRRLAELVGESVNLYVLDGHEVVLLAQSGGPTAIRMFTSVGTRMPAYCTAAGKVLLANLPAPALAERVADLALMPRTPNTIVDPDDLLVELDRIRRRGYAVDDEEQEIGVRCVGAAIRPHAGDAVAAVSISGPTGRINVHHIADLAQRVQETATQIGQRLT
jgi:IclR family acetate operon transcriptional repressor